MKFSSRFLRRFLCMMAGVILGSGLFCLLDSDRDGMPNGWEIYHRSIWREFWVHPYGYQMKTQPRIDGFRADADLDPDRDGLSNLEEYRQGTRPDLYDTDGDGLSDGFEAKSPALNSTSPNDPKADTDGDGIDNQTEAAYGLNPTVAEGNLDPDNDGLTNAEEAAFGSNLLEADIDADGLNDLQEKQAGTNPWKWDSESTGEYPGKIEPGDGLPDAWEIKYGLNPNVKDDPQSDEDHDGLALILEYRMGTDPRNADSDGDGTSDGDEVKNHTDPTDPGRGGKKGSKKS